jgi:hypothetical protein
VTRRLVALPLALLAGFVAVPAAGGATQVKRFQTPSKKIACLYQPAAGEFAAQLRCDLLFLNDRAVLLAQSGKARLIKVTDSVVDPRAKVLRYGRRLRVGNFTCTSRRTGLTCRNRHSNHGFTVSRTRRKLF